ncbi:MAG: aspartate-semialdehyde dehydrogenase [Candidatus Delongbacteria bacterium]|nr:aspartate-semialdehyde dehydrogenase [Candidatus Delongbacteria bacterium]
MIKKEKLNIAVIGATGAVGKKILEVLEKRNFPVGELRLIASQKSVGETAFFKGVPIVIGSLSDNTFNGIDIAFFSAGSELSRKIADQAISSGAVVIDNSSAFRNDDSVPLVIPEINPEDAFLHKGIISNPNCTTAIMLTVLHRVHKEFKIKTIVVSSYQSVSGAGYKGISELKSQVSDNSVTEKDTSAFPHRIAFNVIPHIDQFTSNGYTKEEIKMLDETRKILHDDSIRVSATCVRVPVVSVHSMAVNFVTEKEVSPDEVKDIISGSRGAGVLDDPQNFIYPMPVNAEGKDDCFAGRIRKDTAFDNGISLWICGDQLLKGAALNAVQIAELITGKNGQI